MKKRISPIGHIILFFITGGLWIVIWLIWVNMNNQEKTLNKVRENHQENPVLQKTIAPMDNNRKIAENVQRNLPENTVPTSKTRSDIKISRFYLLVSIDKYFLAYKYSGVKIAGSDYCDIDWDNIDIESHIELVHEPDNPHDSSAIVVKANGAKLGYLPRGRLQQMVIDFERKKLPVKSFINLININSRKIELTLGFYREEEFYKYKFGDYDCLRGSNLECRVYKLTGGTSKIAQENIYYCSKGDEVTITWDSEKEKYECECHSNFVGYLPRSAENFVDMYDDKCRVFLEDVSMNDNNKYIGSIIIFLLK